MQAAPLSALSNRRGAVRLAIWSIVLAALWLGLLPWLAGRPKMHDHLEWLDERGIDPSAMYYTELEAMKPILTRLNRPMVDDRSAGRFSSGASTTARQSRPLRARSATAPPVDSLPTPSCR